MDSSPDHETKQRNIALYTQRDDNGRSIFTDEPLTEDDLNEWNANRDDTRGKFRDHRP